MKKKLIRIWGIGLTLILSVSLLLAAAPVSADTLEWDDEDIPEELNANDIVDIAVDATGAVIYVLDGSDTLWVSQDSGVSWSESTIVDGTTNLDADWIGVAADDPQYLAVAGSDNASEAVVYISDDGGATWDSLTDCGVDNVADIAVAVEAGDNRHVAVVGTSNGTAAEVYYYEIGAIGATWTELSDTGTDVGSGFVAAEYAGAVAFSPYFNSDEIMVVVTADVDASIDLQLFSFNQDEWNADAGFTDYPAEIVGDSTDADVDALDKAELVLAPDYLGSDETQRIAFVAITTDDADDGDEADGLFRMDDDDSDALEDEENMRSVDFDGSLLVAGGFDDTTVYRSTDALASDPDVSDSTGTKSPGGVEQAIVRIVGAEVVAGTFGNENAFAVSEDNGATFNDISLINTSVDDLLDLAASEDGSVMYLVSNDTTDDDISVWRLEDGDYERILSLPGDGTSNWVIRIAPDDSDVIYMGEVGGGILYFNREGGLARWFKRASRYDIHDMAVETDGDVVYVLEESSACYVSKSTNGGFTWGGKETTELSDGPSMIMSLGENMLIVGSDDGTVSYSTDGNESWVELDDDMGSGAVQVTASGLSDGDFVYASTYAAGDDVYRWELGSDDSWDDIDSMDSDFGATGIALGDNGVLYVVAANTTGTNSRLYRFLDPTDGTVSTADAAVLFDRVPQGLKWTSGSVTLWALTDAAELWAYTDTLGELAPMLRTPSDGFEVPTNQVSGDTNDINFSWSSPSDEVFWFDFEVAFDNGFDEIVIQEVLVVELDEDDVGNFVVTDLDYDFVPGETYYWRMRVHEDGPVLSNWSEIRSFVIEEATPTEPVIVEQPGPAPVIEVPEFPDITLQPPEIVIPAPEPAPEIVIPAAPEPTPPVPSWAIYAIIIIGAVLVIALIVLIMRTRRPV